MDLQHINGPGFFETEVTGESRRQKALEEICGGRTYDGANHFSLATLILEDDNPNDPNAVRVEINGWQIGYLAAELAPSLRSGLRKAGCHDWQVTCDAVIRGGWDRGPDDRGFFGVWLDIRNTDND